MPTNTHELWKLENGERPEEGQILKINTIPHTDGQLSMQRDSMSLFARVLLVTSDRVKLSYPCQEFAHVQDNWMVAAELIERKGLLIADGARERMLVTSVYVAQWADAPGNRASEAFIEHITQTYLVQ